MKLGLCTIAFSEMDVFDVIGIAKSTGFSGIELWGKEPHTKENSDTLHLNEIKHACSEAEIEVHAFGSYLNLGSENFLVEAEKCLEICATLKPAVLRIWCGKKSSVVTESADYRTLVENGQKLLECSGSQDIIIAPEFHAGTFCDNSASILQLVKDIGSNRFKTYWQPSWNEDFYRSLETLMPFLVNIHAQNYIRDNGTAAKTIAPLAEGDLDYSRVIEKLKTAGYRGYIEVEFLGGSGVKEKTDWLKKDFLFLRDLLKS